MAEQIEKVEALPLIVKRRILGIAIPAVNLPLFILNVNQIIIMVQEGTPTNSLDFLNGIMISVITFLLCFGLPQWVPVYQSNYVLNTNELRLSRFLRSSRALAYKNIERAEVYIRESDEIREDAIKYAKDSSEHLRKLGFKFEDYTNSESNIALIFVKNRIYMLSPAKPKSFIKSLKKRVPKLTAKIVELSVNGKVVQELV